MIFCCLLLFFGNVSGRGSALVGPGTGGSPEANGVLGILTLGGVGGVPQNEAKAWALWKRAEAANDPASLTGLGILVARGSAAAEVEPDVGRAIAYFEKAAKKGWVNLMFFVFCFCSF